MSAPIKIDTDEEAAELAARYRNLWEVINSATKAAAPMAAALKEWIAEYGSISVEGQPTLACKHVGAGTDWDIKTMAENHRDLLLRAAELGLLRGNTKAINAAISAGMIAWPQAGQRRLYAMPKGAIKMVWADENDAD